MTAHPSGWRRPPILTTTRITFALVVAALATPLLLFAVAGLGAWPLVAYLAFAVLTIWTLRGVRREAGTWLGRRSVRRGIVVAIVADCAALVIASSGAFAFLALLLVLLNMALGWATLRAAGAPEAAVDERQEALRNRSHRIAYGLFAVLVGGAVGVAQVASPVTRTWVTGALTSGGSIVAFFELLFVLPGMTIAWLEPDHLAPEAATTLDRRARLGLAMLAVAIAWPAALSIGMIVLPIRTSSTVKPFSAPGTGRCVEVMATSQVGAVVSATIPVHATACGDGRTATPGWGLNQSDCQIYSADLATVTPDRCVRSVSPDGTLRFTYGAMVRPSLLPFLGRQVTMQVVVDRAGRVVRLP
jgi:hypothetical protein